MTQEVWICDDCRGSGIFRDGLSTCCFCEGTGQYTYRDHKAYQSWVRELSDKQKAALEEAKAQRPSPK
jgi:DnaJ-class molecular chaperone